MNTQKQAKHEQWVDLDGMFFEHEFFERFLKFGC